MQKIKLGLFALLLGCSAYGVGQNQYVYMVRANIPGVPHAVLLTGFRLAGTKGIITCLHGVAGATTISASNDSQDALFNLHVAAVDIRRDLALLTSEELLQRPSEGFDTASSMAGRALLVLGHPNGIKLYPKPVSVGLEGTRSLHATAPPESIGLLEQRRSPALDIAIIPIDGNLVPGDSGAPALNDRNQVVGVIDGGLLGGRAAISWAVPISPIDWETAVQAFGRLQDVLKYPVDDLFALQSDTVAAVDKVIVSPGQDGDYKKLEDALNHVSPGGTILVRPGSYILDSIKIAKPVTIIGDGRRAEILLVGEPRIATTFLSLQNLTIQGGKKPLSIPDQRVIINNCDISSSTNTIVVGTYDSGSLVIKNSVISTNGDLDSAIRVHGGVLEISQSVVRGGSRASGIQAVSHGLLTVEGVSFIDVQWAVSTDGAEVKISNSDLSQASSVWPLGGVGIGPGTIRESNNRCNSDQHCNYYR